MPKRKATISDVAESAGVSIATVSRVINNKDKVSDQAKERVMESIRKLDYQYQQSALLSNTSSSTILMCVSNLSNPFNISVIDGAQQSALQHKYELVVLQVGARYTALEQYEELIKKQDYAGVIMLTSTHDVRLLTSLNMRCPIIMCSEYIQHDDISYVSIDDYLAAKMAVQYLISTGRRKIALLNGSLETKYSRNRERGYCGALTEAGIPINEEWITHIYTVEFSLASTYATHILSQDDRPDAIFAISDVFAVAAIKSAKRLGLHVPRDVSVVGFDNTNLSLISDPSITTVRQPSFQIGFQSCEILIEKIRSPYTGPKQILLETELIIRESTL